MRPSREVLKKGTDAALPTVRLARRVRRLEEGVRENAVEEHVARIEQSLLPLLEAAAGAGAQRRRRG